MLARARSFTVCGIEAYRVDVEVDISTGLPDFTVVGLPDRAVAEAKQRVRAAIRNSGFSFPDRKVVVNLAPGDMPKKGPCLDAAIAAGILAASGQLPGQNLQRYVIFGELSLDGRLRPVEGVLVVGHGLLFASLSRNGRADESSVPVLVVPPGNLREARLVPGLKAVGPKDLRELAAVVSNGLDPKCSAEESGEAERLVYGGEALAQRGGACGDMSEVHGQETVKRALEVAAAGGHHLMMVGPPGSGKTMLGSRMPGILPRLQEEEVLEITKIYSVGGRLSRECSLVTSRPFRAPHHSITRAAMAGGGRYPMPGECSLAHHGVLFLDEAPEFSREVMDCLRQPLEEGTISLNRVEGSVTYPARFLLVLAMNPCKCGWGSGATESKCTCTRAEKKQYFRRIPGPVVDRVDIQVEVPRIQESWLAGPSSGRDRASLKDPEPSSAIRERVERARAIQKGRFRGLGDVRGVRCNAAMTSAMVREWCVPDREGRRVLERAFRRLGMSLRAHDKVLKVARTIADLEGSDGIMARHISEALQYRALERIENGWT